jgi:hypothetical protein
MAWGLKLTSPLSTTDLSYRLVGAVNAPECQEGASVCVRSLDTGWTEEVFLNAHGEFQHPLDLTPNADQNYELSARDVKGRVVWCSTIRIRHRSDEEVDAATPDPRDSLEYASGLEPPWPVCVQRIRHCLHLAATVAQATGRKRDELFQYVHAQERYAEQAQRDNNRKLYRECLDNLDKYAAYLEEMRRAAEPQPLQAPPQVIEVRDLRSTIDLVRSELTTVWKETRTKGRDDLEPKLKEVAVLAQGLGQRCKADPERAAEEAKQLRAEIDSIRLQIGEREPPPIEQ